MRNVEAGKAEKTRCHDQLRQRSGREAQHLDVDQLIDIGERPWAAPSRMCNAGERDA